MWPLCSKSSIVCTLSTYLYHNEVLFHVFLFVKAFSMSNPTSIRHSQIDARSIFIPCFQYDSTQVLMMSHSKYIASTFSMVGRFFGLLDTAQTRCPISICWILSRLGRFCRFSHSRFVCFLPFCNEEFHFCNCGCCNLYVQKIIPILKIHLESISHLYDFI